MYCGQTLALPLLACCDFMGQMPADEMSDSHDHSTMQMDHQSHALTSTNLIESDDAGNNYHCEFCVLSSTALIEIINFVQVSLNKSIVSFNNLSLLPTKSDSLFRPPITA